MTAIRNIRARITRLALRNAFVALSSLLICFLAVGVVFATPTYMLAVTVDSQSPEVAGSSSADAGESAVAPAIEIRVDDRSRRAPTPDAREDAPSADDSPGTLLADRPAVSGASIDAEIEEPAAAGDPYVYGVVVDAGDKRIPGARVTVLKYADGVSTRVAVLVSDSDGEFSLELPGAGRYRILALVDVGSSWVRGSTTFDAEADRTYGIKATLIERSYWWFLALPGY